jgi:hypothetical protein
VTRRRPVWHIRTRERTFGRRKHARREDPVCGRQRRRPACVPVQSLDAVMAVVGCGDESARSLIRDRHTGVATNQLLKAEVDSDATPADVAVRRCRHRGRHAAPPRREALLASPSRRASEGGRVGCA